MNPRFLAPLLALSGFAQQATEAPRSAPGSRAWRIPTGSNLTGPGGRMMPRTEKSDRYRRKNPIPGAGGHYYFTHPVAVNSHTRRRREALIAACSR